MSEVFGAYGKIPAMGDFLRVGLSASFVKVWDDWMQRSLLGAEQALGAHWREAYFSAPIWRFTLQPHHTGVAAMSGIIMASVDRVGRQYPLTLVAQHPPDRYAQRHFANRAVFEKLETLALTVLDHDLGRDELTRALEWIQLQPLLDSALKGDVYTGAVPPDAIIAGEALEPFVGLRALWTTTMDGDNRMMLCSALPNTQEFLALFNLNAPIWQGTNVTQTL
jgi:type VI secretion system protein ImpM